MNTRRQFIGGVAATATTALAGCSGVLGLSSDPDDPIISAVEAADAGNEDGIADVPHSQYPGSGFNQLSEAIAAEVSVSVNSTTVQTKGPSNSEIRNAIGEDWSDEEMNHIISAAENANNTAIVGAEIEASGSSGGTTVSQTFNVTALVATEDGEYKILG
jgi:hypothetical protein